MILKMILIPILRSLPFIYYVMAFFLFLTPPPPCYAIYVIKCYGLAGLANPLPHNVIYEWPLNRWQSSV